MSLVALVRGFGFFFKNNSCYIVPVSACTQSEFECQNTRNCIPRDWLCDGDDDCGDSSDESINICGTPGRAFDVHCPQSKKYKKKFRKCETGLMYENNGCNEFHVKITTNSLWV